MWFKAIIWKYDYIEVNARIGIIYKMISSPQSELKRTEVVKFFHLMQQLLPQASNTLKAKDFQDLVVFWQEGKVFSAQILDSINPSGKDLTEKHFEACVSAFFEERVSSEVDLVQFNKNIKLLLLGEYMPKNVVYQLIREQFRAPITEDINTQLQYKQQVIAFNEDINYTIQLQFETTTVKKLNFILSSIYQSYQLFNQLAFNELVGFIKSGFVDKILSDIQNTPHHDDYYKCLLYLSQASVYSAIKSQLIKTTFFHQSHWESHLSHYYKYANSSLELLSVKTAIEAFVLNFIFKVPEFADYMIGWMASNPILAQKIFLPQFLNTNEPLYVKYNIQIYIELLKRSQQNKNRTNICLANANVTDIQTFAMKVLITGTVFTVEMSIRLLSETVKYSLGNYYNERNVAFIMKALESQPPQVNYIRAVLQTFENSLKYDNSDIYWIFARSKGCMEYIKLQLLRPFQQESDLHCQCLQILYQMARPDLIAIFEEHALFNTLFEIIQANPFLVTFVTKIILKTIESAVKKNVTSLLDIKVIMQSIAVALQLAGVKKDLIMNSFVNAEFPYVNRQIYIYSFKSLCLLFKNARKAERVLFEEDRQGTISLAILNQILIFTSDLKNNQFSKKMIKEEVELEESRDEMKIYRLIFYLSEELMRLHKNKNVDLRRMFFDARNKILGGLYSVLSQHELESENIPIFFEYDIRYPSEFQAALSRILPSTISFQAFRSYILEIINDKFRKQGKEPIENAYFVDQQHASNQIKTQSEFKSLLKNYLKSSKDYRITLRMIIEDQANSRLPYFSMMSRYPTVRETMASTRLSPHQSYRTENLGRSRSPISRSPIRQTIKPYVGNSPREVHMCEDCHVEPSPYDRFCKKCNKL